MGIKKTLLYLAFAGFAGISGGQGCKEKSEEYENIQNIESVSKDAGVYFEELLSLIEEFNELTKEREEFGKKGQRLEKEIRENLGYLEKMAKDEEYILPEEMRKKILKKISNYKAELEVQGYLTGD